MASFYEGLAVVAANLLDKYGQLISFSRQTGGTYDPILENESGASTTTFTGNGAAFNYNKSEVDGTVVKFGDVRLVVETLTTEPAQNDECTVDGIVYRVMAVEPVSPGGTTVINKVQLRV